jgi:hypothetical protein
MLIGPYKKETESVLEVKNDMYWKEDNRNFLYLWGLKKYNAAQVLAEQSERLLVGTELGLKFEIKDKNLNPILYAHKIRGEETDIITKTDVARLLSANNAINSLEGKLTPEQIGMLTALLSCETEWEAEHFFKNLKFLETKDLPLERLSLEELYQAIQILNKN